MIDNLMLILKMLLAILPFVILCIISHKVNMPKIERSKQFFMPAFALVYLVSIMISLTRINNGLFNFINKIPVWIAELATKKWVPDGLITMLNDLSVSLNQFIDNINLKFWIFFIANALIIAGYLLLKKIFITILKKVIKPQSELHTKIASNFYDYFPEKDKWCVKDTYAQARTLLRVFYYSALVLSTVLMFVSREFYAQKLFKTLFYPVFGIIILGEVYFYIDGLTRREYTNNILGEDDEAYRVANYSLLRNFLRSIFGDKLLAENTTINSSLTTDITTEDILLEFEKDPDQKVATFATYMGALKKTGFDLDHNYLYSALDMLNGKSILFNNPFYNDLIPYAFYPLNRTLLSHQKVLVILGRHAIEDDVKDWVERGIGSITNIPYLWNVGILNKKYDENIDIGIVTRSDVLDIEMHDANKQFLEKVGFVIIIEPSKLLSTAQIGLNMLVKKCHNTDDKNIVYCVCDKNCDGLVDAISHALMTSFTEVSATGKHKGTSSYMCWEADDEYLHHRIVPNISRYLGLGTELSFAALKNQVSKTKWYGGESFPVTDIRWINRQYYYDLNRYADLPTTQDAMEDRFITSSNYWSAQIEKNNYFTIEDESYNMFEILRNFSTRSTEQGFINVISPEYMMKDYMADNASIFEADPKAVPCIVADYTRSNRNTILRLILMMSIFPVDGDTLEKELSLLGINTYDLRTQLWYEIYNCYAGVAEISELPDDYKEAVKIVSGKTLTINDYVWNIELINCAETFNFRKGAMEKTYAIIDTAFLRKCVSELKSAGYVAEDEKGNRYYLGAELCGQIYQKYLPGQFFTFGGKYYEMQYLTADGQVLVRRAADHINSRESYRQMRNYIIHGVKSSDKIGAQKNVSGLKIVKEFADVSVETPGYYRMVKYNDFTTAKKISFEGEKNGIPVRTYRNKEILRIELPDFGGKLNDNIRYTITVMFNELFKTLFAENQPYICALTDDSFIGETDDIRPLTYTVTGDGYELRPNTIYIIEDSQLDLGLTVAVERNLDRIFKIVYDYLDWNAEMLGDSLQPPEEPESNIVIDPNGKKPEDSENAEENSDEENGKGKKKRGLKRKKKDNESGEDDEKKGIFGWFKRRRKNKSADDENPETEPVNPEPAPEAEGDIPENNTDGTEEPADVEPTVTDTPENVQPEPEVTDIPVNVEPEPEVTDIPVNVEPDPSFEEEQFVFEPDPVPVENFEPIFTDEPKSFEAPVDEYEPIFSDEPKFFEIPTDVSDTIFAPEDSQETSEPAADENSDSTDDDSESNESTSSMNPDTAEMPGGSSLDLESSRNVVSDGIVSSRKPYHERYYMLFGKDGETSYIDLKATMQYLSEMGMERNPLKQARENKNIAELIEATYKPVKPNARFCDFCGTEIFGVEYETLSDGRDRCLGCSRTAIKSETEFRRLFEDTKRNMETFFGVKINTGIRVQMVSSKKLHKNLGKAYVPTPGFDGRVLGVAIKEKHGGYTLMIENGSPRMASMLTMVHELTHIWQYINWKDKDIVSKYGKDMRLEIYEGMAQWVEIQYAYLINEPAIAKREEIITAYREDHYGYGFLRYRENYPFSTGTVITKPTPFMNTETPLDPEYCGTITVRMPDDGTKPAGEDTEPIDVPEVPKLPIEPIEGAIDRNPDAVPMYAYNQLSDDEKAVYDIIFEAVNNFVEEIAELPAMITEDRAQVVARYVERDHPEIFWYQSGATFVFDADTRIVVRIELKYCLTQSEAEERKQQIDDAISPFLSEVSDNMCDYEVALRIYENIINLVDYDTIGLERQKRLPKAEDGPDDLRSVYGVFVNKKAVCVGYAKATQYLLNKFGIECIMVTSDTHAWNLVKLEGDYYHLDTTWGDGTDTKKEKAQIAAVSYDLFCITTQEVKQIESHIPEDILPLPECTATKCNYHHRHGLYFESFDNDRIRAIVCESINGGKLDISFKFASASVYETAKRELITNGKLRETIQYSNMKSDIRIDSSYNYSVADERKSIAFYLKKL